MFPGILFTPLRSIEYVWNTTAVTGGEDKGG